jgi:hypothetical protein
MMMLGVSLESQDGDSTWIVVWFVSVFVYGRAGWI